MEFGGRHDGARRGVCAVEKIGAVRALLKISERPRACGVELLASRDRTDPGARCPCAVHGRRRDVYPARRVSSERAPVGDPKTGLNDVVAKCFGHAVRG